MASTVLLNLDRRTKFLGLAAFLVISIASSHAIPFSKFWGIDLHNMHVYQRCTHGRSPYEIDGGSCGDVYKRSFVYPPLLYHSFRWLRSLPLQTAMYVWASFSIAMFALVLAVWGTRVVPHFAGRIGHEVVIISVLLLLQFPSVYSLEVGGSDVWPLLLLTLSAVLFTRERFALSGAIAGLATAYKIYPGVFTAVVASALLVRELRCRQAAPRWAWLRFGGSAVLAFVVINLMFFDDARLYFFTALPNFAGLTTAPRVEAHSIRAFVPPDYPGFALLLGGGLSLVWIWAASRALERNDPPVALAGAMAMSTYLQGTSWDYNLITTYPLLLMLFLRAQRTNRWGTLALGLFAIVGDRRLFAPGHGVFGPDLHLAIQLAFLVIAAIGAAHPPTGEAGGGGSAHQPIGGSAG